MKDRSTVINKVRMAKKKYEKTGFVILGIFGSYARAEADEKSDLDLLYELSPDFREKFKGFKAITEINRIKDELKDSIGLKIDLVDRATQKDNVKNWILNEFLPV